MTYRPPLQVKIEEDPKLTLHQMIKAPPKSQFWPKAEELFARGAGCSAGRVQQFSTRGQGALDSNCT